MLSEVFIKSIMLNLFMMSVIILNVIRLNVIAPSGRLNLGLYISRKLLIPFLSRVAVCNYEWAKLNIPL
jgi:hypothetical protein